MNYPSPSGQLVVRGATLLEATLAGSDGVDGCVEQISTDASPSVLPCLVKNAVLGGTVSAIAVESLATYLAVITFDAESVETGSLRAIDAEGSLAPQPLTAENEVVTDVAFAPSGHLVYADQAANGIRVYDLARRAEATTAAIGMGLPPVPSGGIVCLAR